MMKVRRVATLVGRTSLINLANDIKELLADVSENSAVRDFKWPSCTKVCSADRNQIVVIVHLPRIAMIQSVSSSLVSLSLQRIRQITLNIE